jgi:NADPH:quinone reductase-like Zn-dependent oxidoreductase
VAYGTASQRDDTNNVLASGIVVYSPKRFWRRLATDLSSVFSLLAEGAITPHVAARMPLAEAGSAMTLAESRTAYGKVVLVP